MASSAGTTLSTLPTELILSIVEHLNDDERDLNALAQTNHKFHTFFNDRLYRHNVHHSASSGLFWAAANNQKHTIEIFLEHGASLAQTNPKLETPFMLAADAGHSALVQWLLPQPGVNPTLADRNGRMAFTRACMNGHTEVVRFFLTLDTTNPVCNLSRSSPVCLAAEGGHVDVFRLLLSTGKIDVKSEMTLESWTCLSRSVAKNHPAILAILVKEYGLDPDYTDPDRKMSLMHYAAMNSSEAVVAYLLSLGADPDPVSTNPCTPFTHAVRARATGVIKLLMQTGKINVDFVDGSNRETPLNSAASMGYAEIVTDLINSGRVDINKKDLYGQTPLFRAAKAGYMAVVELLLAQNSILADVPDFKGERPFMAAIRGRHAAVAELFFQRDDIEWDLPDRHGHSPLLVAASVNKEAIMEGLLARGARIDCKDEHGRTPFAWAKWWENEEMERILDEFAIKQKYRRPVGVRDRVMLIEGQSILPAVMLLEEIRANGRVN